MGVPVASVNSRMASMTVGLPAPSDAGGHFDGVTGGAESSEHLDLAFREVRAAANGFVDEGAGNPRSGDWRRRRWRR
jgi:hypothetical protein